MGGGGCWECSWRREERIAWALDAELKKAKLVGPS